MNVPVELPRPMSTTEVLLLAIVGRIDSLIDAYTSTAIKQSGGPEPQERGGGIANVGIPTIPAPAPRRVRKPVKPRSQGVEDAGPVRHV